MFLPHREREGGRFGYFLPQISSAQPAELAASPVRGPSLVKDDQEVADLLLCSPGRACLVQRTRSVLVKAACTAAAPQTGILGSFHQEAGACAGRARTSLSCFFLFPLCHLFPVWVQFCTLNSVTTCLPDSSILLIITFLVLNLVIAPALPSHFSLLK